MKENKNTPQEPATFPPVYSFPTAPKVTFPIEKCELIFGIAVTLFSLVMCNSLVYAGLNLGFTVGAAGILVCIAGYLYNRGYRPDRYTGALLAFSLVILAAFPRSADTVMKLLMTFLLLIVSNLGFCLMAKQNLRDPAGVSSLLDAPRATFSLGMGKLPETGRGISNVCRSAGAAGKTGGSVLLGLVIAVPVLLILVPLLMSADAAFEGLLDQLPEFRFNEFLTTLILGIGAGFLYLSRGAALHHTPRASREEKSRKGLPSATVNTVLLTVAFVYGVYLFSQLAYFVGGFSGILPKEYTMAQYARRGFFEMGWLCGINLGLIGLSAGLVAARRTLPALTKALCLFLGVITLFLVAAASAKMLLYIGSYGLTRLRVLTEVFMLWLAFTTVFVCIWLFRPGTPYMKASVLLGLILCAGLMWADVDTVVARYNVQAYRAGNLETVDVSHLAGLSDSAVPYLYQLTTDSDPEIAQMATDVLQRRYVPEYDLRGWNWAKAQAREIIAACTPQESAKILQR